jgi:DNA-binding transcriptional MocR family regulator
MYLKIQFSHTSSNQLKRHEVSPSRLTYELIRSRINTGALGPGEKLPSTRVLAADLGVSRSTVVVIYEQHALSAASRAHERLESRRTIGAVILIA